MTRFPLLLAGLMSIAAPLPSHAAGSAAATPAAIAAVGPASPAPALPQSTAGSGTAPEMTAAEIVARNVAARGGLEAWRAVHSMVWVGRIETARGPVSQVPFILEMERPNKTHFEISDGEQRSARVYDGREGWKLRAARSGAPDVRPFTPRELDYAHDAQVIDGVLIDHEAKGIRVVAEGIDELDGRKAYRLSARLPSGSVEKVWVDAETFLDVRSEREFRNAAGLTGRTTMEYKDFRSVEGLRMPFVVETATVPGQRPDKLAIEKISLNPPIEAAAFSRPDKGRGLRSAGMANPRLGRSMPGTAPTDAGRAAVSPASPPADASPASPPADASPGSPPADVSPASPRPAGGAH